MSISSVVDNYKTAEAVLSKSGLDHLLSKSSTGIPSNSKVAINLPETGVQKSLSRLKAPTTKSLSSLSIRYSEPSQVKILDDINFDKLSSSDLSLIQKINNFNPNQFLATLKHWRKGVQNT